MPARNSAIPLLAKRRITASSQLQRSFCFVEPRSTPSVRKARRWTLPSLETIQTSLIYLSITAESELAKPTDVAEHSFTIMTRKFSPTEIYQNRSVFLIGSTGFLGKVTLSILLHRFPNVGKV